MASIYKKLKDYIQKDDNISWSIFGDLMKDYCRFVWTDEDRITHEWHCRGRYSSEADFLLDYYVLSIMPDFEVVDRQIISFLRVELSKRRPAWDKEKE